MTQSLSLDYRLWGQLPGNLAPSVLFCPENGPLGEEPPMLQIQTLRLRAVRSNQFRRPLLRIPAS